jgi:hypothetical protein
MGCLWAALLMLALVGCSAPGLVRFPADGQSAKLRYLTSGARPGGTYLWHVDRSQCPDTTRIALLASTNTPEKSEVAMFGTSAEAQSSIKERNIPTSEPLTFYLTAYDYPGSCDNAGVFQPLPGRQYELRYVIEPRTFICIVQIDELREGPDGQVTRLREPSAHYFHPPKKPPGYCSEAPRAN